MVYFSLYIYLAYVKETGQSGFNTYILISACISMIFLQYSLFSACSKDPGYVNLKEARVQSQQITRYLMYGNSISLNSNFEKNQEHNLFQIQDQIQDKSEEEDDNYNDEDKQVLDINEQVRVQKEKIEKRFCDICLIYKSDRTHHCSKCKKCVEVMDHHCIWTGNCVGKNNRKVFILVLVWGCILLLHAMTFSSLHIIYMAKILYRDWFQKQGDGYQDNFKDFCGENPLLLSTKSRHIFTFVIECTSYLMFIGLAMFLRYNMRLVLSDTTTLEDIFPLFKEDYEKVNKGKEQNFKMIFGDKWYLWLIPVQHTKQQKKQQNSGEKKKIKNIEKRNLKFISVSTQDDQ